MAKTQTKSSVNFFVQFKYATELALIDAAAMRQRLEIERDLFALSIAPRNAMGSPRPQPADVPPWHPPASALEIAQLLNLFELHAGRVPGFEFTAEGFSISDLIARGLIFKSPAHTDVGCYLIGENLRKAVIRA